MPFNPNPAQPNALQKILEALAGGAQAQRAINPMVAAQMPPPVAPPPLPPQAAQGVPLPVTPETTLPPGAALLPNQPVGPPVLPPTPMQAAPPPAPPPSPAPTGIGAILAPQAPVNPFALEELPRPEREPPTNEPPPGVELAPEVLEERKKGWKGFIERVKTDPDMRLALMQMAIGATQPADHGPGGIGNAMQAGLQTLTGLQEQRYQRGRQEKSDSLEERKVKVQEGALTQGAGEFQVTSQHARDVLAQRKVEQAQNHEYNMARVALEKEGGSEGAVNKRWTRLKETLLNPSNMSLELRSLPDSEREARAEFLAYQMLQGGNTQNYEKFVAEQAAKDMALLVGEDDATIQREMARSLQNARSLADAAGLRQAYAPGGGAPTAPRTWKVGDSVPTRQGSFPITAIEGGNATLAGPNGPVVVPLSALGGGN